MSVSGICVHFSIFLYIFIYCHTIPHNSSHFCIFTHISDNFFTFLTCLRKLNTFMNISVFFYINVHFYTFWWIFIHLLEYMHIYIQFHIFPYILIDFSEFINISYIYSHFFKFLYIFCIFPYICDNFFTFTSRCESSPYISVYFSTCVAKIKPLFFLKIKKHPLPPQFIEKLNFKVIFVWSILVHKKQTSLKTSTKSARAVKVCHFPPSFLPCFVMSCLV